MMFTLSSSCVPFIYMDFHVLPTLIKACIVVAIGYDLNRSCMYILYGIERDWLQMFNIKSYLMHAKPPVRLPSN